MRRENAQRYASLFAECGLDGQFGLPSESPGRRHVWNQYVVRVPGGRRDALRTYLAEQHIGSEIYYPVPLHQQECFASLGCETGSLPETERAAAETIALPIFPGLTTAEQHAVVSRIAEFWGVASPRLPEAKDHPAQQHPDAA